MFVSKFVTYTPWRGHLSREATQILGWVEVEHHFWKGKPALAFSVYSSGHLDEATQTDRRAMARSSGRPGRGFSARPWPVAGNRNTNNAFPDPILGVEILCLLSSLLTPFSSSTSQAMAVQLNPVSRSTSQGTAEVHRKGPEVHSVSSAFDVSVTTYEFSAFIGDKSRLAHSLGFRSLAEDTKYFST